MLVLALACVCVCVMTVNTEEHVKFIFSATVDTQVKFLLVPLIVFVFSSSCHRQQKLTHFS